MQRGDSCHHAVMQQVTSCSVLAHAVQHLVYDGAGDAGCLVPVAEMFEVCPLVAQLQHVDDDVGLGAAADRRVRVQEHPQQGGAGLHAAPQREHFKYGLSVNMEAVERVKVSTTFCSNFYNIGRRSLLLCANRSF